MLPQVEADGPCVALDVKHSRELSKFEAGLETAYAAQGRSMQIYIAGRLLRALIGNMLCFDLCLSTNHVQCTVLSNVSDDLIRYWFLQQIIPILLLLNGSTELLHATAVGVAGPDGAHDGVRAIGFLGRSGIGKSTLLNYCLQQGCELITDEHLALDRSAITRAVPSLPFYRPYRSLEDLGIRATKFARHPRQLNCLYLLEPDTPTAAVKSEPISDGDIIRSVLLNTQYNVFSPRVPQARSILVRRFGDLAALSRSIPVRRLRVPRSMDRLPDVYRFIQNDLTESMKEARS